MIKHMGTSTELLASDSKVRLTRFKTQASMCGICFAPIELQGKLDTCSHEFCLDCIKKWSQRENSCPLCKRRFKSISKNWRRVRYTEKVPRKKKKLNDEEGDTILVESKSQIHCIHENGISFINLRFDYQTNQEEDRNREEDGARIAFGLSDPNTGAQQEIRIPLTPRAPRHIIQEETDGIPSLPTE
eukprot:TRINITY_DN1224_c0_g1_i11.p1 TRINITY_DN1224_c0_g1~~TRINITY_DN1224_c0_g1_i11.p1  ORF type:complete len:187 (-),score=30.75 TRINITY_DN1224_c0_g1_i11:346-906(-)